MKSLELLKQLDNFAKTPAQILAHPAWRRRVQFDGTEAFLQVAPTAPAETFNLKIRFGKAESVLALAPSPAFPEFSSLFPTREQVPFPVLMAIIEKEAGALFQLLEDAVRQELTIQNPTDELAESAICFALVTPDGTTALRFSLQPTPELLANFGTLENLDCSHPSIANLELPADIEYALFDLTAEEQAGLAPGDCLLLPEMAQEMPGRIVLHGFSDQNRLRVTAAAPTTVKFSEITAETGDMRCPATGTDDLVLSLADVKLASGRLVKLGDQPAFQLEAKC